MARLNWDNLQGELDKFQKEAKNRNKNAPFEFFMKHGEEIEVIILRDDFELRREHSFYNPGAPKLSVNIRCFKDEQDDDEAYCPICEAAALGKGGMVGAATLVTYTSVMVLSEYKNEEGKVFKNQVRAARMKSQTVEMLMKLRAKQGNNLEGLQFSVSRSNDPKSPNVGNLWIPGDRHDAASLKKLNPEYAKRIHNWDDQLPTYTVREAKDKIHLFGGTLLEDVMNQQHEDDERPVASAGGTTGGKKRTW